MWRHWNTVVFDWFEIIRRFFFLIFFGKTFSWRSLSYLFDYLLPIPMRKIFFLNQLIISDVWMTEDHVGLKLVLALSIQSFLWECLVTNRLELEMRPHASDKSGQHFLLPIPLWFLFTTSPPKDNVNLIYL